MNVLNRDRLNELMELDEDGSGETLKLLAQMYLDTAVKKISELKTHHQLNDEVHIRMAAHALRSSSINLGVSLIAEISEKIEYGIIRSDTLAEHIHELDLGLEQVRIAFREIKF